MGGEDRGEDRDAEDPAGALSALLVPAATPTSAAGTEPVTWLATVGKHIAVPIPAVISGATRVP